MIERYLTEKRSEPRMLCAELVQVHWKDDSGRTKRVAGNLEDISVSGVCVQLEHPVPKGARLRIVVRHKVMHGRIAWCVRTATGYYAGVRLNADSRWSRRVFLPQHFLDPRVFAARMIAETGGVRRQDQ